VTRREGTGPGDDTDRRLRREVWLMGRPDAARAPSDSLTVVVCYPQSYELGMSNLGFQTAFRSFAEQPGVHCERAFLPPARESAPGLLVTGSAGDRPSDRAGQRADAPAAVSLETGTPLRDFDVVAFSVSYELDFLGLARMLEAGGVPLRARERGEDDPLVLMGGVCSLLNPEPVADFLDAAAIGDARALAPAVSTSLLAGRAMDRRERLSALTRVPGIYVPSFYEPTHDGDGTLSGFRALDGAPLPVRANWGGRGAPAVTAVISSGSHFADAFLVEMSSGCARRCRYCAAGHVYHPVVFHDLEEMERSVDAPLEHTRRVGLVSAALADHPSAVELLTRLAERGVEVTVSSIHADRVDRRLASALVKAGVRTVTLAPETGTERLRSAIGKPVTDDVLSSAVSALASEGIEGLKLYFMLGLPGEMDEDVEAIPPLARGLFETFASGRRRVRTSVGLSSFVPKPRTPFQWLPMAGVAELRSKLSFVRRGLSRYSRIDVSAGGPREARREGVLARGGRELSNAIALCVEEGLPWGAALRTAAVDPKTVLDRLRDEGEVFPWDVVDVGLSKERLLASLRKARKEWDL